MSNSTVKQEELTLTDLFKIRDALTILDTYGMVDTELKQSVDQEIANIRDGGDR